MRARPRRSRRTAAPVDTAARARGRPSQAASRNLDCLLDATRRRRRQRRAGRRCRAACRTSERVSIPLSATMPRSWSQSVQAGPRASRISTARACARVDSERPVGDAVVPDHRRREADELLGVARVGDDLLVAGHRGREHRLADREAVRRRPSRRGTPCRLRVRGSRSSAYASRPGGDRHAHPALELPRRAATSSPSASGTPPR